MLWIYGFARAVLIIGISHRKMTLHEYLVETGIATSRRSEWLRVGQEDWHLQSENRAVIPFQQRIFLFHGPRRAVSIGSVASTAGPETELCAEVRTSGGICAKGRFYDEAAGTAEAADATSHRQVFAGGNVVTFGS